MILKVVCAVSTRECVSVPQGGGYRGRTTLVCVTELRMEDARRKPRGKAEALAPQRQ
jgi:hypothetical protein